MAINGKKKILATAITGMICLSISACSIIGGGGRFGKDNIEDTYRPQRLQEERLHSLGETAALPSPIVQNPNITGEEYTIHTATLYEHPEEAGIDTSQTFTGAELHYDLQTDQPSEIDVSKAGFLLCEVTIKNIKSQDMNITALSLVCVLEDSEELKMVGYPAYFSKPREVEDSTDYYNFNLPVDQSIDAKVGWWVNLEECRKENLFLMLNYGGDEEFQEYWKLDL